MLVDHAVPQLNGGNTYQVVNTVNHVRDIGVPLMKSR